MKGLPLIFALGAAASLEAATLTIDTSQGQLAAGFDNQGHFSLRQPTGEFDRADHFTGAVEGHEWRSFFTFDLSSLAQTVSSAVLQLPTGDAWSHDNSDQTLTFYDVNTDAATLARLGSQTDTFADLGGGRSYGSLTFSTLEPPSLLTVPLTRQAVADINEARGGYFSIGAAMTSITNLRQQEAGIFGGVRNSGEQSLVLTFDDSPGQGSAELSGDYNGDGHVEQSDLDLVLLNWGASPASPPAGWIGAPPIGPIDQGELDATLLGWGNTSVAPALSVPEPATWTLVATIALFLAGICAPRRLGLLGP